MSAELQDITDRTQAAAGGPLSDGPRHAGQSPTASSSAKRINPDDGRFIRLVVAGVIIAGVVAFAISFSALYQVAEWLGLPPFMWWAVPVFIDLAILVYSGSVLVHKARGEDTKASWAALGTFTSLSVFANGAHAWAAPQTEAWQGVVGTVIASMVPVAIFVATEQLSRVAVENPESRRAELRELARMDRARVEHEQAMDRLRFEQEQEQARMAHERQMAVRAAELDREQHLTNVELVRAQRAAAVSQATTHPALERPAPLPGQAQQGAVPVSAGLHVVPARQGQSTSASTSQTSGADLDEVAQFVLEQADAGVEVSAAMLAERFGVSERTGRRRLAALRYSRPHLFELQAGQGDRTEESGSEDERQVRRA